MSNLPALKLYELKTPSDEFGNFVKIVAKLMEVEYLSVSLDANDKKDKATIESLTNKSLTGKFPMLELSDGKTYISEPLSIARFLASDKYGFYGPDGIEKAKTD